MPDIQLMPRVPLPGSERAALAGAAPAGPVDPFEPIEVTVITRRRARFLYQDGVPVRLSREALQELYGSDPDDQLLVARVLSGFGLEVVSQEPGTRQMILAGTAAALRSAFGAELTLVTSPHPAGTGPFVHRYRTGILTIPAGLDGIVEAVLGLDDRPQARPHVRRADAGAITVSYSPAEAAQIYQFPAFTDGTGEHLAIIELGGAFSTDDLDRYFGSLGLATPPVTAFAVRGADGIAGRGQSGDGAEVAADIEIAGATAPGAAQSVYLAPNTDKGMVDALISAISATPAPTAISIGWGQPEAAWTGQAMTVIDQVLADAAVLGVTVCVAAGNNGSGDGVPDGGLHVDFPASSPHAMACGGTSLRTDATRRIDSEIVWNSGPGGATGGGVSDAFALPSWQVDAGVPLSPSGRGGRGVPDVAANADPATGYQVLIDGQPAVVGGTGAVAVLWAALSCRIAQATGRPAGMIQARCYRLATTESSASGFRSITSGDNGGYAAGPGWDPCTGLGSPLGTDLLVALADVQPDAVLWGRPHELDVDFSRSWPYESLDRDLDADDAAEERSFDDDVPESLPATAPAGEEEPRWILAQAFDAAQPGRAVERAFRAHTEHFITVQIGPEREDMLRATGGPPIDEVLEPKAGPHHLVIVFVPPGGEVQSRSVVLPVTGSSQTCVFHFGAGPPSPQIEFQIVVLHRDRVLQSAVLRGRVLADPATAAPDNAIEFELVVVRPGLTGLDNREQFDTAVVVAHSPEGTPTAVGIHDEHVSRFNDDGIERAAARITAILADLADNPDVHVPPLDRAPNVDLLRELAHQGVLLYDAMGRYVVENLHGQTLNAIQVVISDPNDFIPVEMMYDLPPPTQDAGLCANWRRALEDGRCHPAHHPSDPADPELSTVICPLGFWALSKVIERQVTGRGQPLVDLQGMDFAIRSEPAAGRMHLRGPTTAALFAASRRVDSVKQGLSDQVLSTLSSLTGNRTSRVQTWADWVKELRLLDPSLLVLLSHTERVQSSLALEIGSQDYRLLSQITSSLVKVSPDSAPIVLLLGCDTAVADREYQSFAARFREKGAALVVGTIAAVLGEHAAPVAQVLAEALHDAAARAGSGTEEATFGVTMRAVRRKLLAGGELMALCLATFGDADWRLRDR